MPPDNPQPQIPKHVAIIMDGNGRWAKSRGLGRTEGHKAGADAVIKAMECCQKYNIPYLTLYAFSTENWKRSPVEVSTLMQLLADFLDKNAPDLQEKQIRLRVIGDLERIPWPARKRLKAQVDATANFTKFNLTLALSYGARAEIAAAAAKIAKDVAEGTMAIKDIDENAVSRRLQTADLPDPDLIIRTAGEQRLSNFLLWQASYSEFWFTGTLWPDFCDKDFNQALDEYSKRQRRYGKA